MGAVNIRTNGMNMVLASVKNVAGSAITVYSDAALTTTLTLPVGFSTDYTFYVPTGGPYIPSVTHPDGGVLYSDPVFSHGGPGVDIVPVPTRDHDRADISQYPYGELVSGQYYFAGGQATTSTSGGITNNSFRVAPFYVPTAGTLTRLGAEITGAGEAGSKLRLGVYADNGRFYPGALLVDAGQLDGTSATVQELTISTPITPGLYWFGAAPQSAPTTPPTVRINTATLPVPIPAGTAIPTANQAVMGVSQTASGALPATFNSSFIGSGTTVRIFFKVA